MAVERIVSGGQTGVDRAALDVAIALGIDHGGWCPAGRKAEDGTIPRHYRVQETASVDYAERTEQNVLDSDATLILGRGEPTGGTALTARLAERHGRPCLLVDLDATPASGDVQRWLTENHVRVLNLAGPRESTAPGIAAQAQSFLLRVLR
ncbi:MAG: putative molybdenum carrier protein [Pirellulales bacterium]